MATTHNSYEVSDSATVITNATSGLGHDVTIQNNGSEVVYLGGEEVSSDDYGFKLIPNAAISFELDSQDKIYAYSPNGTIINVLTINLERTK